MLCCRLYPCLSHERLNALLPACGPFFFQSWIHCVKLKALPISHLEMMLNKLAITIASHVYTPFVFVPHSVVIVNAI